MEESLILDEMGLLFWYMRLCKDSRHVTIPLRHESLNRMKIIRPEEASRMRCDTVAIKK